jgi:acyl-coenzyme A synthetase/AMP-(fatty) acid ligase
VQDYLEVEAERPTLETEWILLTSGTTNAPKLVVHTLRSLTCSMRRAEKPATTSVWSTFYDIRRYGGLQVFLRAALTGAKLVLSSKQETMAQFLTRARTADVTPISGTPSHWRRALMSGCAGLIAPQYVRLSGEIADQTVLDQLRHQ